MTQVSKTLILVNHPEKQKREDFEEIRAKINILAPDIDVQIVKPDQNADELDANAWRHPCLVVSFGPLAKFRPKRGAIYCCRPIPKFEQLVKLSRAGVAVPLSSELVFGRPLDRQIWGELVVLKPTTPGFMSQGNVYLMRTERVAALADVVFPPGHPVRARPVIIQQFVDTGERPCFYRVLTLFGEPLYCLWNATPQPRPALDSSDEVLLKAKIATNAEFGGGNRRLVNDSDVLDMARRAFAAMPAIPLQGVDIIRERASGRLFILEVNPGGNTWHFSSGHIRRVPTSLPRAERIAQFGAWDVAARVLVKTTRSGAR